MTCGRDRARSFFLDKTVIPRGAEPAFLFVCEANEGLRSGGICCFPDLRLVNALPGCFAFFRAVSPPN